MNSHFSPQYRNKVRFIAAIAVAVFAFSSLAASSIVVTDDRGENLVLMTPARRIVTLAPFITELVYAAGAGPELAGVSAYSDYPQQAASIMRVGDATHIDLERIAALRPDLVLAWESGNHVRDVAKLEALGISIFVMEPTKLSDIPRLLRRVGMLAGTSDIAEVAARKFESKLAVLTKQYSTKRPVRVFYEVWNAPLMTVNGAHVISSVLRLCGGVNVFAASRVLTPVISPESLVAADPDAIISSVARDSVWQRFAMLDAVRNHRVFFVPPELLERQSPRILEGASEVCSKLDQVRRARK